MNRNRDHANRPTKMTQADYYRAYGAVARKRHSHNVERAISLALLAAILAAITIVAYHRMPKGEPTYELVHYGAGQRYVLDYDMSKEDCAEASANSTDPMTCEVSK